MYGTVDYSTVTCNGWRVLGVRERAGGVCGVQDDPQELEPVLDRVGEAEPLQGHVDVCERAVGDRPGSRP